MTIASRRWSIFALGTHCVIFISVLISALVWWEIQFEGQEFLYSSPSEVWKSAVSNPDNLWEQAQASISRVFVFALPLGWFIGCASGLFLAMFVRAQVLVMLTLAFLIPIPRLAINIWMEEVFGGTELMLQIFNTFIAALLSFVVCYNGAVSVQKSTERSVSDVADAARVYFPSHWQYYWRFLLPVSERYIFAAAYLASAFMWPMLIFAESNITAVDAKGVGRMIYFAGEWSFGLEEIFLGTSILMICSGLTWLLIFLTQKMIYRFVQ